MSTRQYPEAVRGAAIAMIRAGGTVRDTARALNVPADQVRRWGKEPINKTLEDLACAHLEAMNAQVRALSDPALLHQAPAGELAKIFTSLDDCAFRMLRARGVLKGDPTPARKAAKTSGNFRSSRAKGKGREASK